MKKSYSTFKFAVLLAVAMLLTCVGNVFAIIPHVYVINNDGPNEGFNDTTPAAPVGGNPKTTKGEQRLYAFQFAADKWAATLDSNQDIYVVAAFNPLGANVLGSAGAWDVFSDMPANGLYPGAEFPHTWYSSALADKRAGVDQDGTAPDINAQFSSDFDFYLGVDNNHGAQLDLVAVLLHELGHGLGFQNFVNEATGDELGDFEDAGRFYPIQPDIYERHTLDTTTGKYWHLMTRAQRKASAVNYGNVVWDGANVTADVPAVLSLGSPEVKVLTPPAIARIYQFGTAAFGPPISSPGISGPIVPAQDVDEDGATATFTSSDGCSPFSNAGAISGKIALVERGGCGFAVKARNATNAGAIGCIIYNQASNVNATAPGMAGDGVNDPFVTIPTVSLNRPDGLGIVNNQPATGSMSINQAVRAGADPSNRARLYMPYPVSGGSSGSHYDNIASRNLLMEPAINQDLTHELDAPDDLTLELLRDIGWFPDADGDGEKDSTDCEPNSDLRATVIIGDCDSGVPNIMFTTAPNRGCTLNDAIDKIEAASVKKNGDFDRAKFEANAKKFVEDLKKAGTLTNQQKDAINKCIAKLRASTPHHVGP